MNPSSRTLRFVKMHGAGNDFVMVDHRGLEEIDLTPELVEFLCDRRLGVGGDGLIVLGPASEPGREPAFDFRMDYFNSDGRPAEMCGNGARCTVAFASALGRCGQESRFATASGVLRGTIHGPGDVEVSLPGWRDLKLDPPVAGSPWPRLGFCNTGVPHLVVVLDRPEELEELDVGRWGPFFRRHEAFGPGGTNVDWVVRDPVSGRVLQRTYERGVEAETLACGTGASATAVVLSHLHGLTGPVPVQTRGGDVLTVTVGDHAGDLRLRGPAVVSFTGEVSVHG
ncbi:MAG: diaminopimelate epimerase [bacterium]